MNKELIYSLMLHTILLIIAYFGLPSINPKPPEEIAISFDILEVSKISNVKKIEPQKENKLIEEEKSNREIPIASSKESEKSQENIIEEKKPEQKLKEKNSEQIKPDESVIKEKKPEEIKKEEPSKEPVKQELEKDKKRKDSKKLEKSENPKKQNQDDELDSLLKTLEAPRKKNTDEKVKAKDSKKISTEEHKKSDGNYDETLPLSMSEKDMIGNQIYKSWYFQGGGKDAKDMYVVLVVNIDRDGKVKTIEIQDLNKYNKANNAYRIFVDSAIRAVKKASPFQNLAQERYNAWRELELNFDPRGVIF